MFDYQRVIRSNGSVLGSTPLTVKINLRRATPSGTVVYSETDSLTTNPYGVFSLTVGSGVFANIDWETSTFYIETEIDFGSGCPNMGTTQ